MVAVADQFDILTVAENVENSDEAAFLTELGVNCLQGYNFGATTVKPPWLEGKETRKSA
jgi:EAL domain-containing protein (putative c-di-GMP-specific phosphodiesterase class I)